jgi:hypothetical protein
MTDTIAMKTLFAKQTEDADFENGLKEKSEEQTLEPASLSNGEMDIESPVTSKTGTSVEGSTDTLTGW